MIQSKQWSGMSTANDFDCAKKQVRSYNACDSFVWYATPCASQNTCSLAALQFWQPGCFEFWFPYLHRNFDEFGTLAKHVAQG